MLRKSNGTVFEKIEITFSGEKTPMLMPSSFDPKSIQKPHLVTIGYSHYCELSRWALEHAGIDFEEIQYIPGYHGKFVGQLRRNKSDRSQSSYVGQESGVHGGRRKYAVPLVCLPGGRVLKDSWEVLEYALGETDEEWKTLFDEELGVSVRQLGYHYLLAPESKHLLKRMISSSSVYERILWLFINGKVIAGIQQLLAITPENVERSKETVRRIFESVGAAVTERGGTLSSDGSFGAMDIAFCSLAAYCVMPDNFGNGAVKMPGIDDFTPSFQTFIRECRETAAGQYIMNTYDQSRTAVI